MAITCTSWVHTVFQLPVRRGYLLLRVLSLFFAMLLALVSATQSGSAVDIVAPPRIRPTAPACSHFASLNDYDMQAFVGASFSAETDAWVETLAALACQDSVLKAIDSMGGRILFTDRRVGYTLFRISRERVLDALDLPGVDYATIPRIFRIRDNTVVTDGKLGPLPAFKVPFPQVATTLPADGPYFPEPEAGLTALWAKHPQADGRGVKIAVVDSGFDLLHPALLHAKDANGILMPKVADIDTASWPEIDNAWVQFGPLIQSDGGVLRTEDGEWLVPFDAAYRFGKMHRLLTLGTEGRPVEHPVSKLEINVGVLWSEQLGQAWFDTDGDGDFANDRPLSDYSVRQDIAWFGHVGEATDNRVPFGIKIAPELRAIYVSIGETHGSSIAGPMAANRITGGLFNGAAPSAQLIDSHLGVSQLSSHLKAFARSDTDVINRSGGIARGIRSEEFAQHVLNRAQAVYEKPFVCFCYLPNAIHVNDYQSAEMLRRNRRVTPHDRDAINTSSWFSESGLINGVLAPSTALLTESRYMPGTLQWPDGKRHLTNVFLAPPAPSGYSIGSNASPTVALVTGIVADLIGHARQENVRFDYKRLTSAVLVSAKLLSGFSTAQQGHGLVDAAGAWAQLVQMARADDPKNPMLTSFTIARPASGSVDGKRMPVHGFHADLPQSGMRVPGALWVTRTGGYDGPRPYRLRLRGDDGTYRLVKSQITLPRDEAVKIGFEAKALPGTHVAFIQLIDMKADAVMQEIPLSLRAPETPMIVAPGVELLSTTLDPLRSETRHIRLDRDVQAVRFVMRIPYSGPEWQSHCWMPGFVCSAVAAPAGEPVDALHHVGPMQQFESLVANNSPGTTEAFWSNRGNPEYGTEYDGPGPDVPIQATLRVTKYAIAFAVIKGKLHVKNRFADIEGRVELHEATRTTSRISGHGPHQFAVRQLILPGHLSQWRVAVSSPVPADAFLMNCTDKKGCTVAEATVIRGGRSTLVIDNPNAGDWRVVIRSRKRSASPLEYRVDDALLSPSTVELEPDTHSRRSRETWILPLPLKRRDSLFVAFRIAGHPQSPGRTGGLSIAMTRLGASTP